MKGSAKPPTRRDIIVIGASAGGVEALRSLAAGLPADLPAAVFVVLHLAPDAPSILPDLLSRAGPLPALHPPADGAGLRFQPGHVYVAPPGRHMVIDGDVVRAVASAKENGLRPAVDTLFRSAARHHGRHVIGVVLTGALDDGTAGLEDVKREGGLAIVQDPGDALFPSMPTSALQRVAVDHRVPLAGIPSLLARLAAAVPAATAPVAIG
jgi:two-component system, chemotaxis family, protein-glutamate methylesterase/glutaminase